MGLCENIFQGHIFMYCKLKFVIAFVSVGRKRKTKTKAKTKKRNKSK